MRRTARRGGCQQRTREMSPATDSPDTAVADQQASSAETDVIDPASTDPTGRAFGRVRGQRLEITPADLTMYSVITGRAPSREERERALTWSEADPMNGEIDAATENGASMSADGAVLTL